MPLIALSYFIYALFFWINHSDSHPLIGGIIMLVVFTFIAICISISLVRKIIVDLGDNTLTLTKVGLCTNKCKTYMPKELLSILLKQTEVRYGGPYYHLNIYPINPVNGEKYEESVGGIDFTKEEEEYFNYYINKHIQLNMN